MSEDKLDSDELRSWLEWAGRSLMALPVHGTRPSSYRSWWPAIPNDPSLAYGYNNISIRIPPPQAHEIRLMDEIFDLIVRLPADRSHIRRILQVRSLISPLNGRYIFGWTRIATMTHSNRHMVRRDHSTGLNLIVREMNPSEVAYFRSARA